MLLVVDVNQDFGCLVPSSLEGFFKISDLKILEHGNLLEISDLLIQLLNAPHVILNLRKFLRRSQGSSRSGDPHMSRTYGQDM
ncbi:hypothetical protein HanRHA438_Chr09g0391231 [Helianthus annuus]|nr:hypothetical protein HanIR_Chr09g0409091 [Helianthus annuus]KAJ0887476.1 hypothetical protein HanRHA438_Chr09g0391231 [Helianthus annuus]